MNKTVKRIINFLVYIILGAIVGFFVGNYAGRVISQQEKPNVPLIILALVRGVVIQIIVH